MPVSLEPLLVVVVTAAVVDVLVTVTRLVEYSVMNTVVMEDVVSVVVVPGKTVVSLVVSGSWRVLVTVTAALTAVEVTNDSERVWKDVTVVAGPITVVYMVDTDGPALVVTHRPDLVLISRMVDAGMMVV